MRLAMPYLLRSHDAWGSTEIGRFETLEQAQTAFEAVRNDRWFNEDGTMRRLSLVEEGIEGGRTLVSHDFQAGG